MSQVTWQIQQANDVNLALTLISLTKHAPKLYSRIARAGWEGIYIAKNNNVLKCFKHKLDGRSVENWFVPKPMKNLD